MNNSNTLTVQGISEVIMGRCAYVTIDGLVKYCITAPLLELPIDFKEWYKQRTANSAQLYQL